MIVDLPEKFSMEGVAVIENGILKIMRYIAFSDIKNRKYHIPIDWIEEREVSDLVLIWIPNYSDNRYKKEKRYYEESGMFKKIVIVDRNNKILSGALTYVIAKKMKLKTMPVISLENVELTV